METLERPTEQESRDLWRAAELTKRGFDEHSVELLVGREVDLHQVDRLLDLGCPRFLAVLILI